MKNIGPRISVACFFTTYLEPTNKIYGPIKDLLSDDNPPMYRQITVQDFVTYYYSQGIGAPSVLPYFKL